MVEESAEWIVAMRRDLGISQAELAKRIRVSQGTISNWENGRGTPDEVQFEFLRLAFKQQPERVDPSVEGLENSSGTGWGGEYPLDSVFVRTEPRNVNDIVRRIRDKRYDLNPDFQRDFVWDVHKQSRLIESCLMRIPLPVLYVAEAPDGRIIVVDGLQRLTTFRRFLDNELVLTFPPGEDGEKHSLQGKKFQALETKLQERIEDTSLTLYILDSKAPERAKLDIFERVNSGAPLTRQQMRNCLYNGPATQWLRDAATTSEFRQATGESLDSQRMRDREAINRFCAFYLLGWREYRTSGDMDNFLAKALDKMNRLDQAERDAMAGAFQYSMAVNFSLFGPHAFRKSLAGPPTGSRSVLNIAFFDVCSVLIAKTDPVTSRSRLELLGRAISALVRDPEFAHAITYSTNSRKQVEYRFGVMEEQFKQVLA